MPQIDEDGLKKLLKTGYDKNVFMFYGDDDYLKNFYCEKIISVTVDDALKAFNLHIYEDDDTSLERIFADAEVLPVMADKTCLLIKNYPLNLLGSAQVKSFEKQLSEIPETTVMIFYFSSDIITGQKNSKWDNISKIFIKLGNAVKIDHRTQAKTAKLLVSRAKEKGTQIDIDTANYLIECVGSDMSTLLNEFNKVCAYSCGQPVTKEMVDITAVKSIEASVFDISTSIFDGNTDKAYKVLQVLLKQKTPAQSIIGALASSYVNLYRYKVALNADKTVNEFAKEYQYRETKYQFRKISGFARKTRLSSIRKSIYILSEADIKSKTMKINDEILLTELIAKLVLASRE